MIRRLLKRGIPVALVALILLDVGLLALVLVERRALRLAKAHYDEKNWDALPIALTGFSRGGVSIEQPGRSRSFAVRYASKTCPYSLNDDQWKVLAPRLKERGIQVITLLPNAEAEFGPDALVPRDSVQVAYAGIDWIERYPLALTPTLLIFDAKERLIWHQEGTLGTRDVRSALEAVDRARGNK